MVPSPLGTWSTQYPVRSVWAAAGRATSARLQTMRTQNWTRRVDPCFHFQLLDISMNRLLVRAQNECRRGALYLKGANSANRGRSARRFLSYPYHRRAYALIVQPGHSIRCSSLSLASSETRSNAAFLWSPDWSST